MKLLMLKGLPGAGKSKWAKEYVQNNPGWVRINKDSLREMMGSYRPGKDENLILKWRDSLIMASLRVGKNVIIDDTNFHPKHAAQIKNLIYGEQGLVDPLFMVDIEEKFFDTPLEECIKNDLNRPKSVGEKVIKKMWQEYLKPKVSPPKFITGLPKAIICDIDGTIAIHNDRSPYEPAKCGTDKPNWDIIEILDNSFLDRKIILVTGREDQYRSQTMDWLNRHGIPYNTLHMRPTGDFRKDDIIKQEIYDREIKYKYNIDFVLDDRNRVVDMWRRNGLTCLQVADGNF